MDLLPFKVYQLFPKSPRTYTPQVLKKGQNSSFEEPSIPNESFDSCDEEVKRIFETTGEQRRIYMENPFPKFRQFPDMSTSKASQNDDSLFNECGEVNFESLFNFMQDIGLLPIPEKKIDKAQNSSVAPEKQQKLCQGCGIRGDENEEHLPTQEYFYEFYEEYSSEESDEESDEYFSAEEEIPEELDLNRIINVIRKIDILPYQPDQLFLWNGVWSKEVYCLPKYFLFVLGL